MFESNTNSTTDKAHPGRPEEVEEQVEKTEKQDDDDEELARKLQVEEDAKSAALWQQHQQLPPSILYPCQSKTFDPSITPTGNRVVGSKKKVVELAESEIGLMDMHAVAHFTVVKFGRKGRPHERKMWLNAAMSHLCWDSSKYPPFRGLRLEKVIGIKDGEMTPTIRRVTKNHDKVAYRCFSLETDARTLDLKAEGFSQKHKLVEALKKVIEFNHRHKPRRINENEIELYM